MAALAVVGLFGALAFVPAASAETEYVNGVETERLSGDDLTDPGEKLRRQVEEYNAR